MPEQGLFGKLALAFAQTGQGQLQTAAQTYQELGNLDEQGASYTASGLGDIALYQGRFTDAIQILTGGATADIKAGDLERAASKWAALAHAHLLRVYLAAGDEAKARAMSVDLASNLQAEPQAYARVIDGLLALQAKDARRAVQLLTESTTLLDTWIGHFELGRAYLAAAAFTQADSEFERCIKRRGEALSLFLDEEPTYAFLPPVYYYQGLVKEGLKSAKAAESYRNYLDIRGKSTEDPLVPEVRRRIIGDRP
jgi:tetratricopeptide (TPR) repeat protein